MSRLGRRQRETPTTILSLLTDQMDGVDGGTRRRRSLKERLGFIGMGCCGATWVFRSTTLTATNGREQQPQQEEEHNLQEFLELGSGQDPNLSQPECLGPIASSSSSGMNLAAALAAERELRGPNEVERVSLMRLLEETEEVVVVEEEKVVSNAVGNDSVCCVCMGRNKGAAFIPCGHTFCRVCSRELWLNRGSCPLCNRSILEILDIF
ncbi:hypothetical protein Lal_00043163 [Lupinus albus]|uniref:Putative transcription factor C2H2 family n=1 Tax=Lupinus albus TaxID=3870 RepID=A0A6A4NM64_LUPAL|nr:putative transcription factor C2H2 family [Lupinus albus]KAF1890783.1 hypothetical protein Lal_00043163 [Lupinus albus]